VTVVIGMALLITGSFFHGTALAVMWIAAAAIDYAGPAWLTRERLRGLQEVAVAHFAERYGLFVIICLGESIVAIGLAADAHTVDAKLVAAIALGLTATVAMWWTYFDRFSGVAEARLRDHDDVVLAAADSYSYLHLLIVAGIIVFAVGMKATIRDVGGTLSEGARLALCGGLALYLVGNAAFRLRMAGELGYASLAGAGGLAAVFALGASASAVWITGLSTAVLVAVCMLDALERAEAHQASGERTSR